MTIGSSGSSSSSSSTSTSSTTLSTTTTTQSSTTTTTASSGTQTIYGQCGGSGWTGPTTCASGSTCKVQNQWYSQCLP
jgi:hypothetical protein